jgi:septum formation inhibitor-activating ATPase MinD
MKTGGRDEQLRVRETLKGGVGQTTVTLGVAAAELAARGVRVILTI